MGLCNSSNSTHVATAKVVLHDGQLQEFSYPVKVSYVLLKNPSCFICDSDDMDFDGVVSPLKDNDELFPGNLYFALPLSKLRRRLEAEEMAALAVKASSALMKSGCGEKKCACQQIKSEKTVRKSNCTSVSSGNRRGRWKFTAMLTVIPE
ncbi:hypothetical protein ACFE04_022830 [Oxalis oulophora]